MSFLAPLMFAFALTLPVIVVLYLLKLKRQRQEVPSTLLWLRSLQDLTANAPFQRLRNNLLLWLQLLIAALIVFALARPFLAMDQERNETKIVLIDTSASMQATDVEDFDTRLDQAKAMALELVDNLGPGDRMIVATFNSRTELASLPTDDASALRAAIRAIEPTDQPTDITDALVLVRSLVQRHPNPEVILLSDGALGTRTEALMEMLDEEGDAPPMRYIRCGTGGENVGLVAFSLSRGLSDQSRVEIFAEVLNATTRQVDTILELSLDGERIDAKSLTLEPEQSRGVVFTNFGDVAGTLRIQLDVD
ncbi:BatA domain-containing protein, partial [Candidatus Sumerlaeota bacterium]|nr:BatA domain-containing protein [Candidatus Sumerlaeota bacterium]